MKEAYPVVTTEAFVLHTYTVGEADRKILLFTENSGAVEVFVKSVRKEGAKLKGFAYPYRKGIFSFIVGKRNILKDVTAIDPLFDIWSDETKYKAYIGMLRLVRDYVPSPSTPQPELFDILDTAVDCLQDVDGEYVTFVSLAMKGKFLSHLGYIRDNNVYSNDVISIIDTLAQSPKEVERLHSSIAQVMRV